MGVIDYFKISQPQEIKIEEDKQQKLFKQYRIQTFIGVTIAYCFYYLCRLTLGVIKQPIIDDGLLNASQLGIIGSTLSFVYAIGKCTNGFIADHCNIKRFMAWGLGISAILNLIIGAIGYSHSLLGFSSSFIFIIFAILWAFNGWSQSMGPSPGVISLSRWFPQKIRGRYLSIFISTPYLGSALSIIIIGAMVNHFGWQSGFIIASIGGILGVIIISLLVVDTPESKGLASIQKLSGEEIKEHDKIKTKLLQRKLFTHPAIWVIALASAFVYITRSGITSWGIFFLQKEKLLNLQDASFVIGFSEAFGIIGTVFAGFISDKIFKGNRLLTVLVSGLIAIVSLIGFIFIGRGVLINIIYIAIFCTAIGILYCTIAALIAIEIFPRKITGAAMGLVGISSYLAVGIQEILSGFLINDNITAHSATNLSYNFIPMAIFWISSCILATIIPLICWKLLNKPFTK